MAGNSAGAPISACTEGERTLIREDAFGDALKPSLISTKGMQSSVCRLGKRLTALEIGMTSVQHSIDKLSGETATKKMHQDLVEALFHTDELIVGNSALYDMSSRVKALAQWATREQVEKVEALQTQVAELDGRHERLRAEAARMRDCSEEHGKETAARFEALWEAMREHAEADQRNADHCKSLEGELMALERRVQQWTRSEIRDFFERELTTVGSGEETASHHGASPPTHASLPSIPPLPASPCEQHLSVAQKRLVQFLTQALVGHVREELLLKIGSTQGALDETRWHLQALRSRIGEVDTMACQTKTAMRSKLEEIDTSLSCRPTSEHVLRWQARQEQKYDETLVRAKTTEGQLIGKCVDILAHLQKVQDMLDGHEHTLQRHAEEIRSRCTMYDQLLMQVQLDSCVTRDDFDEHIEELRQDLSDVESALMRSNKDRKRSTVGGFHWSAQRRSTAHGLQPAPLARKSVAKHACFAAGGEEQEQDTGIASLTSRLTTATSWFSGGAANATTGSAEREDGPPDASSECWEGDGEGSPGEEKDYSEEARPASNHLTRMVHSQLEGVTMGLFSLAYLVLRVPRRGGSLSIRLDREKELLDELGSLRYWVTHGQSPRGWDLSRLTTMVLRYANLPEEAIAMMPQVATGVDPAGKANAMAKAKACKLDNEVGLKQSRATPRVLPALSAQRVLRSQEAGTEDGQGDCP